MGGATGSESHHTAVFGGHVPADDVGYVAGEIFAAVVGSFENACIDFFLTGEGCKFKLSLRRVIPPWHTVELYLRTKVCFH